MQAARDFSYGEILDQVRNLRWRSRGAVAGVLAGRHSSRRQGTSAEFTEYRPYRQGDPPQKIDWKVFARTDRAYVRLSRDHAVLPTAFIVDASGSMAFPAEYHGKYTRACGIAVALASIAYNSGDPVGVVVASGAGTTTFPPRNRLGAIGEIARTLSATVPGGTVTLADALTATARLAQRVVLISDMLGDLEETLGAARQLRAGGVELYAMHVVAREEVDPPMATMVEDAEDPTLRRALSASSRVEYEQRFGAWRAAVSTGWRGAGVFYRESLTHMPLLDEVRQVIARAG